MAQFVKVVSTEATGNPARSGGVWSGLLVDSDDAGQYNRATIEFNGHSDEDGVLTSGHTTTSNGGVAPTIRSVGSGNTQSFGVVRFTLGTGVGTIIGNNIWAQAGRGPRLEPALFRMTSGTHTSVHFEARVRRRTLGTDDLGFAIGLTGSAAMQVGGVGSCGLMYASGTLAGQIALDRQFVGFRVAHGEQNTVIACAHTLGRTADTNYATTAHTLVADEFVKLGFRTQKLRDGNIQCIFYANGVEVARTNINAVTFPFNTALKPIIYVYGPAAGSGSVDVHWLDCVQKVAA